MTDSLPTREELDTWRAASKTWTAMDITPPTIGYLDSFKIVSRLLDLVTYLEAKIDALAHSRIRSLEREAQLHELFPELTCLDRYSAASHTTELAMSFKVPAMEVANIAHADQDHRHRILGNLILLFKEAALLLARPMP